MSQVELPVAAEGLAKVARERGPRYVVVRGDTKENHPTKRVLSPS